MLASDPIDLPVDPITGDLVLVNGRVTLTSGVSGVVQGIRQRLQLIRGEWFLDLDAGVPMFERVGVPAGDAILGQKWNEQKALAAIRAAILAAPGVLSITSLTAAYSASTRAATITWQARTVFGDTPADTLALGA